MLPKWGFSGGLVVKNLPAMQGPQETQVQSLGQKDPLEEGMATHSCLENPMDRGAWQATIHGVSESRTQLKQLCTHICDINWSKQAESCWLVGQETHSSSNVWISTHVSCRATTENFAENASNTKNKGKPHLNSCQVKFHHATLLFCDKTINVLYCLS